MTAKSVVIVGAGQAAAVCAMALREKGFAGEIIVIGDEEYAPYERPELSKKLVSGESTLESVTILDPARADTLRVRLLTGCTVASLDRVARTVRAGDEDIPYDWLVLATGGRARRLDQAALTGLPVLTIRTAEDAERLRKHLKADGHVAVIGGGWLGLELAASCRSLGMQVDLIEASERLCSRAAPPALSQALHALHMAQGVRVHCGEAVTFQPGSLMLGRRHEIQPDFLIVAVGMEANDHLAAQSGLATDRGILVDTAFQTQDPHVFAIGDCAVQPKADGPAARIESWQNANHSAQVAASRIAGLTPPTAKPLWFWSDQFGTKLQMAGALSPVDEIVERVTGPNDRMAFHLSNGMLTGVWALGAVRDFAQARRWLAQATRVSTDYLSDPALPLQLAVVA